MVARSRLMRSITSDCFYDGCESSISKAWQEFDEAERMKDSSFWERVVDVAEEFAKFHCAVKDQLAADEPV
jgi:NAD(P)H-dependent FMN reductase